MVQCAEDEEGSAGEGGELVLSSLRFVELGIMEMGRVGKDDSRAISMNNVCWIGMYIRYCIDWDWIVVL
jgi:hypothetical protein